MPEPQDYGIKMEGEYVCVCASQEVLVIKTVVTLPFIVLELLTLTQERLRKKIGGGQAAALLRRGQVLSQSIKHISP